ncbi:MAG: peptide ABC transporter permease [Anaerolinea sp.]|nr:peptide ABC transporter permease [Anaerolinea sp.]
MVAQEPASLDFAGSDVAFRSFSDRPLWQRWLISTRNFAVRKPLGALGVLLILLVVFSAVFASVVARYDPEEIFKKVAVNPDCNPELAEQALTDPSIRLKYPAAVLDCGGAAQPLLHVSPSSQNWLGTDVVGRDLYARIIYGSRTALLVGLGAALIATFFGVIIGLISAYFGGTLDFVIQRFVDTLQAFPALVLLLLFGQVIADISLRTNIISLGILGIASTVRIVRSSVLAARSEVYVTAAQTIGASDSRIMARHIFPNITAPIIVTFTSSIGIYILVEATLAFLGLGDPTRISWGKMIEEGRRLGPSSPGVAFYVGCALTLTVLGFNLAGDALRDVLDPRLRGRGGRAGF